LTTLALHQQTSNLAGITASYLGLLGSNFGMESAYPEIIFGFRQSFQANARRGLSPSTPTFCSSKILPVDTAQFELLTA
jgi:hypothetical protein